MQRQKGAGNGGAMSKKTNTLLFMLGATLFNILITLGLGAGLLVLYIKCIVQFLPESGHIWGLVIIFVAAIGLSFVVYRFILKLLLKKVDVERYFDPIFGGRRKK
jgi:riboflavin transporter FmnP